MYPCSLACFVPLTCFILYYFSFTIVLLYLRILILLLSCYHLQFIAHLYSFILALLHFIVCIFFCKFCNFVVWSYHFFRLLKHLFFLLLVSFNLVLFIPLFYTWTILLLYYGTHLLSYRFNLVPLCSCTSVSLLSGNI